MNIFIARDGSGEGTTAMHTATRGGGLDHRNFSLLSVAPSYPKPRQSGRRREELERRMLSEITHILSDAKPE
jgi:hypothetical protein